MAWRTRILLLAFLMGGCVGVLDEPPSTPLGPDGLPIERPIRPGAPGTPQAPTLRRLTVTQYQNSVRDLLGENVTTTVALEADSALNGFVAIGAARATISPHAAELYEEAAFDVAAQAISSGDRRSALVTCTPSGVVDSGCARTFVTGFGRRAWRRPLSVPEIDTYAAIADHASTVLGDFYQGIEMVIAALLQSPNFLFRAELGEPAQRGRRYSSLEMASRLSFFLWNSTPDDALLDAGERGDLATPEGIRLQAERLVAAPRARQAIRDFFSEMLRLDGLSRLPQDSDVFPQATATMGASMREGMLRTIEHVLIDQNESYRSLFDTRVSFVNAELAALYGVSAPSNDFARIELPEGGDRAGLLGQGALLALGAHSNATSPTLRGKLVREVLLCQSIAAPPPNVGELPEATPELPTMRERLQMHRENPNCASCHAFTDPIGLGLENFDAIGAFRERENDAMIDPSGDLDGVPFADARGLGEVLRDHPRLTSCLVRNAYRYATGHVENAAEEPFITTITQGFDTDPRVLRLLVDIAASDGFRLAGALE